MSTRFDLVTIDTPHTDAAAAFWCAALGLVETGREDVDRWIVLAEPDGSRRIGLQRGESRPGGVHLDLVCAIHEFAPERSRLLTLGATETRPPREEPYGAIANFAAPDGTLFDLCAYR